METKWLTQECECEVNEFGARVLAILRDEISLRERLTSGSVESQVRAWYEERAQGINRILEAARDLGLLDREEVPQ